MLPRNPVEALMTVFDSQADIAAFCMVDKSTVTRWKEKGKIPPEYLTELSRYTSIPIESLFRGF
jgi:hypothetical protein